MLIRQATAADAEAVAAVAMAAGQPTEDSGADGRYYDLLLRTGTVLVAEGGDGVFGWGAVRKRHGASMLTDLFVHPEHHGEGVGTRLLDGLWASRGAIHRRRFVFSSLHPHALPLYIRAGLATHWPLLYLVGPGAPAPDGPTVTVVAPGDAAAAEERLTGRNARPDVALYGYWASGPGWETVVISDGGRVAACGALRPGEVAHLSCAHDADVVRVVAAAVSAAGPDVKLCVPGPHPAVPALLSWGFRITQMDVALSAGMRLPVTNVYSPGLG